MTAFWRTRLPDNPDRPDTPDNPDGSIGYRGAGAVPARVGPAVAANRC